MSRWLQKSDSIQPRTNAWATNGTNKPPSPFSHTLWGQITVPEPDRRARPEARVVARVVAGVVAGVESHHLRLLKASSKQLCSAFFVFYNVTSKSFQNLFENPAMFSNCASKFAKLTFVPAQFAARHCSFTLVSPSMRSNAHLNTLRALNRSTLGVEL